MKDYWHTFIPDVNFESIDLYTTICETLIDEGKLAIEHLSDEKRGIYKWKIKSSCNKIVINSEPGQILRITMEDKDNSKIEFVA